jgi:hypothetical protein
LLRLGLRYEVVVLETLHDATELDTAERRWIALGREALGRHLTNDSDGGGHADGVAGGRAAARTMTQARKDKIAAALRGRPKSPEHRAQLSVSHREVAKRLGASAYAKNKGRHFSAAARANMGAAHHGLKHALETKQKIGSGNSRRVWRAESRAKVAQAIRQIMSSPDARRKVGDCRRGRPLSAEHREAIARGVRRHLDSNGGAS